MSMESEGGSEIDSRPKMRLDTVCSGECYDKIKAEEAAKTGTAVTTETRIAHCPLCGATLTVVDCPKIEEGD